MKRFMNWMLLLIAVFGLCVMPACGTIKQVTELAGEVREAMPILKEGISNIKRITELGKESFEGASAEVKEAVAEFKQINEQAKLKADVNKDGDVTGSEWITYLATLLAGGSGYVLRRMQQGSQESKAAHQQSAADRAALNKRLDDLERKAG